MSNSSIEYKGDDSQDEQNPVDQKEGEIPLAIAKAALEHVARIEVIDDENANAQVVAEKLRQIQTSLKAPQSANDENNLLSSRPVSPIRYAYTDKDISCIEMEEAKRNKEIQEKLEEDLNNGTANSSEEEDEPEKDLEEGLDDPEHEIVKDGSIHTSEIDLRDCMLGEQEQHIDNSPEKDKQNNTEQEGNAEESRHHADASFDEEDDADEVTLGYNIMSKLTEILEHLNKLSCEVNIVKEDIIGLKETIKNNDKKIEDRLSKHDVEMSAIKHDTEDILKKIEEISALTKQEVISQQTFTGTGYTAPIVHAGKISEKDKKFQNDYTQLKDNMDSQVFADLQDQIINTLLGKPDIQSITEKYKINLQRTLVIISGLSKVKEVRDYLINNPHKVQDYILRTPSIKTVSDPQTSITTPKHIDTNLPRSIIKNGGQKTTPKTIEKLNERLKHLPDSSVNKQLALTPLERIAQKRNNPQK